MKYILLSNVYELEISKKKWTSFVDSLSSLIVFKLRVYIFLVYIKINGRSLDE